MHLKFSLIQGVAFDGYSLKRGRLYEGWHLVGMALQKGDYSTSKKYISIENNNVNIFPSTQCWNFNRNYEHIQSN